MTTFYYRVLSVDPSEHTFCVRYWTDKISEKDLRVRDDDHENPPIKCRTDYNLTSWKDNMSSDELHELIVNSAPKQWFELKEKAIKGPTKSMKNLKDFVNINKEARLTSKPLNESNQ